MLIYPPKKALVLRLRDPARVTSVIPGAKLIRHDGKDYVAVRHGLDETRVLRNLGIDAPSPIDHYYHWPGQFKPFAHQRATAGFLTLHDRAFNLSDIGTGKSISTLWAYDYLRSVGRVRRVLIVAPLSTLERTWGDELFRHFPHLNYAVLHGTAEKRVKLLENRAFDIYIINHDGIKVRAVETALKARDDIDLIIVDEIAQISRRANQRFKALARIIKEPIHRMAWGLTGTPTPNSPLDAWAQCRLIVPHAMPPYLHKWKEQVMRQVGPFLWTPRDGAADAVHRAMQPAIRFVRDECIDLPPCMTEARSVELTPAQRTAYLDMVRTLHAEAEQGSITAVNAAVKMTKLLQIACGVAYAVDGSEVIIGAENRLAVVREVIDEAPTKVIVFVPFIAALHLVANDLRQAGHSVECIHGAVGKSERDRIFAAFQKSAQPRVLVAQPASMSHGLTLTEASTIIWYAPVASNDIFEQANGRITRPGQKHSQLIVTIEGTPVERKLYATLEKRQSAQDLLLTLIRDTRREVEDAAVVA